MKVTLEHHESASTQSAQADQKSAQADEKSARADPEAGVQSAKNAKSHRNTTGEESTVEQAGIQGGIKGGVQDSVQNGIHETTNLPQGFSFDPAEGFKLDDPQHGVCHNLKPILKMK